MWDSFSSWDLGDLALKWSISSKNKTPGGSLQVWLFKNRKKETAASQDPVNHFCIIKSQISTGERKSSKLPSLHTFVSCLPSAWITNCSRIISDNWHLFFAFPGCSEAQKAAVWLEASKGFPHNVQNEVWWKSDWSDPNILLQIKRTSLFVRQTLSRPIDYIWSQETWIYHPEWDELNLCWLSRIVVLSFFLLPRAFLSSVHPTFFHHIFYITLY